MYETVHLNLVASTKLKIGTDVRVLGSSSWLNLVLCRQLYRTRSRTDLP
eukprot:SAG31_NODE_46343_length_255_cov_0.583333_1_plen_48_part_10